MADIKVVRIESLPATTAVTEDDYLVVQQPDLTRRVKIGDVVHVDGTVSHVISFKEGGKLNGPMDFAYFEEEDLYLRWKGEFPHTVPALSSPYADGGITDAAWMVYTDPSLREELESTIGASMIMTAEGQSVQDVMDVTVQTANDAKALAQRVDFGTVHTVGDVIHLDNFVGPAVIEERRTTNYPSVAAGEKFLNGVVSRRDTTTVDGIFRGATSGAMYTISVTNGVATTKRIALRDEFKRLEANNPTRTVIRAGDDLNTAGYLQLDATGRWGMWNQQTASWQPLAIEQGGTGARDAAGVRINIGTFYKQRAALEPNFNINNLTGNQDGVYYQPMTAYATEANGYPAGSGAGTLIVLRNSANEGTGCIQIYKMYLGGTWERYYNNLGSGMAWSPWKRTSFPENTTAPVMPDLWLPLTSNLKPALGEGEMVFSRPSTATYFTKRGVMAVAQANQPRFERDGLLIEGQRTNLMLNSEDPSKWGAQQAITVGSTVTNTNGTKGARFTVNTTSGVETTALNLATVPATRGADVTGAEKFCTGSIIARGGKAHQRLRVRFDMYNGSTTVFQGDAYVNLSTLEVKTTGDAAGRIKVKAERWQTAGPAWIRIAATFEAVASDNKIGCQFQIAPPEGAQHAVGDWVDVAIPQFELGSCESSFIPTGSSPVTRAADLCKFPMTDNLAPRPFTIAATVDANWRGWGKAPNAAPRVIDTEGHQYGASFIMGFGSATNIAEDGYPYCDIGGSNRRVYEMAKARKLKIGFRIKDDGKTCSFANGLVSTETQSSWEFLAGGAFIRIGGQTATGERHLFGHIKDIRVWNSALTDTQLMMESVE